MGKSKTAKLKRVLANVLHNQERAAQGLVQLHNTFAPVHEGHGTFLADMIETQLQLQELALRFWEICWRKRPADYNVWR